LRRKSAYQEVDAGGSYGGTQRFAPRDMTANDHRMVRAAYWAMCDLVDGQIGRILSTLEDVGQARNTIIIFMSDHGEMLGDHGIYLKGPYFYEPAIHIPLIIRYPAEIAPARRPELTEAVDLAPTVLDACGLPGYAGMQGRSLWPLLKDPARPYPFKSSIYCEYYNAMPFHRDPTAQLTMLRTEQHKLVVDHAHNRGELYDLSADPLERNNTWSDPSRNELKAELLTSLTHRMAWTVDPLPPRLCEW
jgi:arylsulfatase A-like enzyme